MPKTARGHQQSSVAKMFPPLDVHSKEDIAKAIKQIMKGPITILLVYADWCGHCHEMMPHWDAATKSPHRTVPSIKLNEKNTESFNEALSHLNHNQSSIHVSGYPTVLVLDNKGNKITDVEAKKDTASLTQLMNRSGPLAEKAGLSQPQGLSQPKGLSQPQGLSQPKEFSRPQVDSQEQEQEQEEPEEGLAAQGMQGDVAASLEPLSLPLASPPRRKTVTGGAQNKGGLYRALHPRTHKNRR
jgi:thiol-disulfide isomerase/thioredoxin